MRRLLPIALLFALPVHAEVVERLPTRDKVVALTFDACEGRKAPATFDEPVLAVLKAENVPFTVFATGRFARRNAARLAELAASPLVEVENHSFDHPQHMERLAPAAVRAQVDDADREIERITGRKPLFFRFPAGNYDPAALAAVEASGHRVVHWTFASGDPVPGLDPERLRQWVLDKTRPGSILIFHVNGRAPATHTALPAVIGELRQRGYRFVRLDEALTTRGTP
ncbi:MAG: polysaccharide deacetylase family protein [Actinomycetota bacterium]